MSDREGDMDYPRTGDMLEREGLVQTPVGKEWKSHLDNISFGDSPLTLMCDPMNAKLWKAFGDYVRKCGRKAQTVGVLRMAEATAQLANRMPDDAVMMDLLNWAYELETHGGVKEFDDDMRGWARDRFDEFVTRVLIEGKSVT